MREDGVVRKGFTGDVEAAQDYTGFARTQLGILKNAMSFNNLQQLSRKIELSDGTVIFVSSIFGQDTIRIDAPLRGAKGGAKRPRVQPIQELVIVGAVIYKDVYQAYRWTEATGIVVLDKTLVSSKALAISRDGLVITGVGAAVGAPNEGPFVWTQKSGVVFIDDTSFVPADISDNGTVIVGKANTSNNTPFLVQDPMTGLMKDVGGHIAGAIWTKKTGVVPVVLDTAVRYSSAFTGVTGDGNVAVGNAEDVLRILAPGTGITTPPEWIVPMNAIQWTQGHVTDIVSPGPVGQYIAALAVSKKGEVLVGGYLDNANIQQPWMSGPGGIGFTTLNIASTFATAVSDNGEVIAGSSASFYIPFVWKATTGALNWSCGRLWSGASSTPYITVLAPSKQVTLVSTKYVLVSGDPKAFYSIDDGPLKFLEFLQPPPGPAAATKAYTTDAAIVYREIVLDPVDI